MPLATMDEALIYILLILQASPELIVRAIDKLNPKHERRAQLTRLLDVLKMEPMENNFTRYSIAWKSLFDYQVGDWIEASWRSYSMYKYPAQITAIDKTNRMYDIAYWDGEKVPVNEEKIAGYLPGPAPLLTHRGDNCFFRRGSLDPVQVTSVRFLDDNITVRDENSSWMLDADARQFCLSATNDLIDHFSVDSSISQAIRYSSQGTLCC